jgi:hypothetical protein
MRQLPEEAVRPTMQTPTRTPRKDRFPSMSSIENGMIPLPPKDVLRLEPQKYNASEENVYASIRNSNPHTDVCSQVITVPRHHRAASNDSVFSSMGALSAVPRPLFNEKTRVNEPFPSELEHHGKSHAARRPPSYEGTGYRHEISSINLHAEYTGIAKMSDEDRVARPKVKAPSRLPTPIRIQPVPYAGQLKATVTDTKDRDTMSRPKAVPWPGHEDPPSAVPWPGSDDPPPAIPAKNPNRWKYSGGHVTANQLTKEEHASVMRIVSKENIRAALGGTTPDASTEDLNAQTVPQVPSRIKTPQVLPTYNTHMFPRKDQRNGTSRRGMNE